MQVLTRYAVQWHASVAYAADQVLFRQRNRLLALRRRLVVLQVLARRAALDRARQALGATLSVRRHQHLRCLL